MAATNTLGHRPGVKYGENCYWSSGSVTGESVVQRFYAEAEKYDYNNPRSTWSTGHFSQLVWKSSQRLGIGVVRSANGVTYVCCNYDPPETTPESSRTTSSASKRLQNNHSLCDIKI